MKQLLVWLDERTGLPSAIRHFLDEEIPASAGWHQVLGSVALFAFLLQIATGLLLALNYGPTPSEAHASLRYIMTELTGGSIIRGLHHWGSSAMIIVVGLHMMQTFIWGAYKKPREATWMVGVVLLLLTMAFGLSGYLLPWDNRAYWGTMVTTQIAALAPGLGQYVARLLGSEGGSIGVITFSRFYTAHIMLLPLVMLGGIVLHVILVRRHGVTPMPQDEALPKQKFFPKQVFKDTVAVFAYVMAVALLAVFVKVGLGSMADPTDTAYIPRPEWYFLFLFQVLKYFAGPLEIVGALVLPNLAIAALFLTPFLDRGRALRVQKRTFAMATVAFAVIGWAGLTQQAVVTTPSNLEDPEAGLRPPALWKEIPAEQLAAVGFFRKSNCTQCHVLGRSGVGPDLAKEPSTRPADWLTEHFTKPVADGAETGLTGAQMKSLIALVSKRNEKGLDAWAKAPAEAVGGAMIYHSKNCGFCHTLNGTGGTMAPPMNGLAGRHDKTWIMEHFENPKKFVPTSSMPAFKMPHTELVSLTDYILAIPK